MYASVRVPIDLQQDSELGRVPIPCSLLERFCAPRKRGRIYGSAVSFSLSVPCHEKLLATVAQAGRVADLVAIMSECPGGVLTTTAIVTIAEALLLSGNTTVFADFLRAYVVDDVSESMDVSAVLNAIVYARAKRYSTQTAVTAPEVAVMIDIIDLLETAPVHSSSSISSSGSSSSSSCSSSSSGSSSSSSMCPGELGDML